jgi:hypothetical protein
MKKIDIYDSSAVRNACVSNNKVLIIADYRGVSYYDEDLTEVSRLADELGIEYYPVIALFDKNVKGIIDRYYIDYQIFIEGSLLYN